jgi:hypothetical protein
MLDSPEVEPKLLDLILTRINARFDEVMSAIVEHRQYIEFASDRFRGEMLAGFASMSTHFERLERKLDQLIDHVGCAQRDN